MSENLNDLEMAKKRDYKIMITDAAINKVPRVQYKGPARDGNGCCAQCHAL